MKALLLTCGLLLSIFNGWNPFDKSQIKSFAGVPFGKTSKSWDVRYMDGFSSPKILTTPKTAKAYIIQLDVAEWYGYENEEQKASRIGKLAEKVISLLKEKYPSSHVAFPNQKLTEDEVVKDKWAVYWAMQDTQCPSRKIFLYRKPQKEERYSSWADLGSGRPPIVKDSGKFDALRIIAVDEKLKAEAEMEQRELDKKAL